MLGSIRKFSGTIYAKILLGIIILPFVFWGMGSSIRGGSKNVIVVIDKEKYSVQQFSEFIKNTAAKKIESNEVERFLSSFIGEKLMEKEIEHYGIKLSDNSLGELIKHQKEFKRKNEFSRIEYEKFLLKNNMPAAIFEANLSKQEKKKHLLEFIGSGVLPSHFLINNAYDKFNQKRSIELINLKDYFEKKITFSEKEIKSYFDKNQKKYIETYKSIKILELSPKKLTGTDDYNNLFFERIDEIDDAIVQGSNLENIKSKYNLEKDKSFTFNKSGKEINSKPTKELPKDLIKDILNLDESIPTILMEKSNKYFIVELTKIENLQQNLDNESVKKDIVLNLKNESKRKLISEIISKINNNNFSKLDFDKISSNDNIPIQTISLKNKDDDKIVKKELVKQIYSYPEKRVFLVNDIYLTENFLVYVNNIENVTIDKNSDEYKAYLNMSKLKIANELYNTYDVMVKKKYKIDINYQTLNTVKNYFN